MQTKEIYVRNFKFFPTYMKSLPMEASLGLMYHVSISKISLL